MYTTRGTSLAPRLPRAWGALLVLLLISCVPSFAPAENRVSFVATAGALTVTASSPVLYGSFAIQGGAISSAYCTPTCQPDAEGVVYLRLPEGPSYGTHVLLGRYEGTPSGGTAAVVVEGERDGLEAELTSPK